mgnify:CR=1 FL=1
MVRINNRKLLEGMLLQYGVPKTKMKPFKEKLTPGQIDALVKWVRGLKADPAP